MTPMADHGRDIGAKKMHLNKPLSIRRIGALESTYLIFGLD
jgi:hypothetical protein